MLAIDLKKQVGKQGSIAVRIIAPTQVDGQGNLSDYGVSVAGISTYLEQGMHADIVEACQMPHISLGLLDAKLYNDAMIPGYVYFVFHHDFHRLHNEKISCKNWTNDKPAEGCVGLGSAIEVGAYTGYDMVGFPADQDMSKLLEPIHGDA
jgi:hypothetical protein